MQCKQASSFAYLNVQVLELDLDFPLGDPRLLTHPLVFDEQALMITQGIQRLLDKAPFLTDCARNLCPWPFKDLGRIPAGKGSVSKLS